MKVSYALLSRYPTGVVGAGSASGAWLEEAGSQARDHRGCMPHLLLILLHFAPSPPEMSCSACFPAALQEQSYSTSLSEPDGLKRLKP